jgi:diaminohydroxyphosphoribosylaminopyrimidine deaminase/5-amino-6-(5-phosphoribosylamino)uracil reductase
MTTDELIMQRCLQLAKMGAGFVSPNPMVGCVIVYDGKIIGEGYHQQYGQAHAEVNAIESVKDKSILSKATLYVSLEPCAHYGKTPPCADLIIKHKLAKVFIAAIDPYAEVNGKGIAKLKEANIKVVTGVLEKEAMELNKYFTYATKNKLPYVILKWAQTADKFIAPLNNENLPKELFKVSNTLAHIHAHKLRSEVDSIMVGTNTAAHDNPALSVRNYFGRNPVRVVLDRSLRLQPSLKLLDKTCRTIVFTEKEADTVENIEFITLAFDNFLLPNILKHLYENKIQSLLVEGGSHLLQSLIDQNLWNEAIIYTSKNELGEGVRAPVLDVTDHLQTELGDNTVFQFYNRK